MSSSSHPDSSRLTPRPLGRTADVLVPPVIWRAEADLRADVVERAIEAGADWFFLSAGESMHDALLRSVHDGDAEVILGVSLDSLLKHAAIPALEQLPDGVCAGVMLQDAIATDLKGGRPFHRLMQLRDSGKARVIMLEAADVAEAEWMVDHTPAQAVCLPYGLIDQTARYRVLPAAAENGTALIARDSNSPPASQHEPIDPMTSVAFVAGENAITSMLQSLPPDVALLDRVLAALKNPMPEEAREKWWGIFRERVAEPPKPRGAHPPEYGT